MKDKAPMKLPASHQAPKRDAYFMPERGNDIMKMYDKAAKENADKLRKQLKK